MTYFKKGMTYTYKEIEDASIINDLGIEELGNSYAGEGFIVVKDFNKDSVCSFMFDSAASKNYYYTCIYNDF